MKQYNKKSTAVKAIQFVPENFAEIADISGVYFDLAYGAAGQQTISDAILFGQHLYKGDWIVRWGYKTMIVMSDEEFRDTFEVPA